MTGGAFFFLLHHPHLPYLNLFLVEDVLVGGATVSTCVTQTSVHVPLSSPITAPSVEVVGFLRSPFCILSLYFASLLFSRSQIQHAAAVSHTVVPFFVFPSAASDALHRGRVSVCRFFLVDTSFCIDSKQPWRTRPYAHYGRRSRRIR